MQIFHVDCKVVSVSDGLKQIKKSEDIQKL